MSCNHTETKREWVKVFDWDEGEREELQTIETSTCVDIDLHRFKCTRCGEIGYYSGAARRFYEGGATKDDLSRLGFDTK